MKILHRCVTAMTDIFKLVIGVILGYVGVLSNIAGAVLGVMASVFVVCFVVGICVYVRVLPMFTEAREVVFDKMVNLSEEDFMLKEDTVIYDKKGNVVGSVNAGQYKYVSISDMSSYIYDGRRRADRIFPRRRCGHHTGCLPAHCMRREAYVLLLL